MQKWLIAEIEKASATLQDYRQEYLAGGEGWQESKKQRDYWHGYKKALQAVLAEMESN